MKKYLITLLAIATLSLVGCGSSQEQRMIEDMKAQLEELQARIGSDSATASCLRILEQTQLKCN